MLVEFSPSEKLLVQKIDFTVEELRRGKITLLTDLDGSRVRTALKAIELFNVENKTNYSENDILNTWAMSEWAKKLGKQNPDKYAIGLWNSDFVMGGSYPVQGASELERFLYYHRDAKIITPAVTARPAYTKNATEAWHKKWMGWVEFDRDIFMQTENEINPGFKADVIASHAPTYYLEDQIADAEKIAKASPTTTVILVSQPWNANYIVPTEFEGRILKPENVPQRAKVLSSFYTLVEHATL